MSCSEAVIRFFMKLIDYFVAPIVDTGVHWIRLPIGACRHGSILGEVEDGYRSLSRGLRAVQG